MLEILIHCSHATAFLHRQVVPRLLAEMDAAEDFYFDSISQIVMDSWIKGRVGRVGDAG